MIIELELELECRAFVYEGFLTEWECDYLISIAKPHLKRSVVAAADDVIGEGKLSKVRTSFGMFIPKNKVIIYVLYFLLSPFKITVKLLVFYCFRISINLEY